jgi:hypothetical protein
MTMLEPQAEAPAETGEIDTLARKLAAAYLDRVEQYMALRGMSLHEATAKANEPAPLSRISAIGEIPLEHTTWADLGELNTNTPEMALQRWRQIREAALEAVRSGDCAGGYLEGRRALPWQRALFLAIRQELADGWQPRNGVERQLLDMMAQAQVAIFYWEEQVMDADHVLEAGEAAGMVDRFNRIFVRNLRALCELRKAPQAVVVQNVGGQVNLGQQQLNTQNGNGHGPRKAKKTLAACTCPADQRSLVENGL